MEKNLVLAQAQIAREKSIEVLHATEIDRNCWDALVAVADGPLYCTFDYLSCCGEWEAVVLIEESQYWYTVPIPYRERGGIKYVYQSPFTCYLTFLCRKREAGSFEVFKNAWREHLRSYKYLAKYFFCDYSFRELVECQVIECGGLKIDLTRSYQEILKGYSHDRARKLRKPTKNLTISMSEDLDLFFKWNAQLPIKSFQPYQLVVLRALWEKLSFNGQIELYLAAIDEELFCGTLIGKFGTTLYSLAAFSTANGRKTNALTQVTDHLFQKYAQSHYTVFDFGSMTGTGIDDFKLSFGAERYRIYQIYKNNLPWYVKIPKSILNYFGVSVS